MTIEGELKRGELLRETATGVRIELALYVSNVVSWRFDVVTVNRRRPPIPKGSLVPAGILRVELLRKHFDRV